ncbi:uncharacterized protein MKK02DRAFT_29840 [Dioszegia hungarica]|uniref:Uncharacterized protein n=1 Tax=Dioszegia hungarica TaxID=4972 RepID=A0AA38HGR1_9TREE|nr:uncharacterized protein MKK02DRAFT_29840 [Dioszegia hungarica]KAI9639873.1 hypothetical protein MKK02DRAFT_29840 [Dioszegia hungarica]
MSDQEIIQKSEQAINASSAQTGSGKGQSLSTEDSGVNENVTSQFPGSTVQVGGTKRGENPTIPVEEGGEEANKLTGSATKAKDFEGAGGPEEKIAKKVADEPGAQDVSGNVVN